MREAPYGSKADDPSKGAPGIILTVDFRVDRATARFGPDRKIAKTSFD